jgi:hypothetical protein
MIDLPYGSMAIPYHLLGDMIQIDGMSVVEKSDFMVQVFRTDASLAPPRRRRAADPLGNKSATPDSALREQMR